MILNPGKCYFMCIDKNVSDSELLNLNDLNLKNCKEVEILGITIDRNLNFKGDTKNICKKVGHYCMLELERNAHCVAFQKDPEKGYHWNDPSRHVLIVYLSI